MNKLYLGIDLGTTNSQMATVNASGIVEVIPNMDGDLITGSIVSVGDKKPTVGKTAKQDRFFNPEKVSEQFKKMMATVTESGDPIPIITGNDGTEFTAIMLSAEVLSFLKKSAEKVSGMTIDKVVVSVPAYFKRQARLATKQAALIAGFKEVHIVDEPTASATYYGLAKGKDQKIAVFDFGGGTFDICILNVKSDGGIDPIAVEGDPECGGSNVDEVVFLKVKKFIESKGGKLSPDDNLAEWMETLDSCKQAKEMLANKDESIIPIRVGSDRFSMKVTYSQLKDWSAEIIENLTSCCKRALQKANLTPSDIDSVVLVGGSSRLRFVNKIVKDVFGKEPVTDTDPDMAVAKGNAVLAAAYFADSASELMIEGRNYVASSVRSSQIAGRDLCAAIITKLDAGDEREYNFPIIPSGAKLPFEAIECFTPISAQSSKVSVKLIDGNPGELSSNFTPMQEVDVSIQPASEEENGNRIEYKIAMDTEGLVDIKVRDKLLNKPIPINFKFHTGLSDKEIKKQKKQLARRHSNT